MKRYLLPALLLSLAPATSWAAPEPVTNVADEADLLFSLGNQAYVAGDYERALTHYFASNRLAPNSNVTFNVARCYERLKRWVEAYRYYAEAAEAARGSDRPDIEQALARVRPYVALLEVVTQPPGATLYIQRRDLGSYGTTPRQLALAAGEYTVIAERSGFHPARREGLRVEAGQRLTVELELAPILGQVKIGGTPRGAAIRTASGQQLGNLPATLSLPPGDHPLTVTSTGYVPGQLLVRVAADRSSAVDVQLAFETGTLVVQSEERGALISIDGKPAGFTPAVIDGVRSGAHQLTVELAGFRPFQQQIVVRARERLLVDARLNVAEDVAAASRVVETVQEAPASVSLISRAELDALAYTGVGDALVGTRGFVLNDDFTYQSLSVRGYSQFGDYGNRVLVQLDGHTINDDWIGSSYIGFDLLSHLGALERIEAVRGPGSVLYGTGAFFGVVNLVTPERRVPHTLEAGVIAAGDGVIGARLSGGAASGDDLGFWISTGAVLGQPRDFFSPARLGSEEAPDGTARGVGAFDAGTVLARGWWRELAVQAYLHQRRKQIPTGAFGTIFGDDRTRGDDRRAFAELRYEPQLTERFQLLARAYLDHYHYDGVFPYQDPDDLLTEFYEGNWGGLELRGRFSFDTGRLTAGVEFQPHFANIASGRYADGSSYLRESHPFFVASAYANVDASLLSWLRVSFGGRYDVWSIDGLSGDGTSRSLDAFSPRLALILKPSEEGTLKLLGGTAFRAPSIYELTYWDGGLTQIQSPELTPERVYTGELEYSHRLPERFVATGAIYLNRVSDVVTQIGEGDETDPLRYINREDAVLAAGIELELRRELRRGTMGALQYTAQRVRAGDLADGPRVPGSPEHTIGLKLVTPIVSRVAVLGTRLAWDIGRRDRDLRWAGAVVLWDAAITGDIPQTGFSYAVRAMNLLDWHYELPVGAEIEDPTLRQPGRTLLLDLSYVF